MPIFLSCDNSTQVYSTQVTLKHTLFMSKGMDQHWYGIVFLDTIQVSIVRISQFSIPIGYGYLMEFCF